MKHAVIALISMTSLLAFGANNIYQGPDGGDLGVAGNWSGGVPTAVTGYFSNNPSSNYRVTISEDLTLAAFWWSKENLWVTVDLGGHALTLSSNAAAGALRPANIGSGMVFTNGTISLPNSHCRLVGSSATVVIGRGATVNMETRFIAATGKDEHDNEVRVEDGGVLNGLVAFDGNTSRNRFVITGPKTFHKFLPNDTSAHILRHRGSILVSDGAAATNASKFIVGASATVGNLFRVSGAGTTFEQDGQLVVGPVSGSNSNRFEVTDGAYAHLTGGHHGLGWEPGQTAYDGGFGNEILVSGPGTKLFQNGNSQYLYIGRLQVAGSNRLVVADGAVADIRCLSLSGIGNEVVLSNGTLTIQRLFYANTSSPDVDLGGTSTIRFAGTTPQLFYQSGANDPAFRNTRFVFSVPTTGYSIPTISTTSANDAVNITIPDSSLFEFKGLKEYAKAGGGLDVVKDSL